MTSTTTCARSACPPAAPIRASLGLASNFADVHRFMDFAAEFVDLSGTPDDLPERRAC